MRKEGNIMYYRRIFDLPTWGFRRKFGELDRLRNRMDELYGALSGGAFPKLAAGVFPLTNITEDGILTVTIPKIQLQLLLDNILFYEQF